MSLSESVTVSDFGSVFPPRDEHDILAYNSAGVRAGYLAHAIGIASPTPDAGAAFRWGWATRAKDLTLSLDGFEDMRLAAARLRETSHERAR